MTKFYNVTFDDFLSENIVCCILTIMTFVQNLAIGFFFFKLCINTLFFYQKEA